ncbi:MAG: ROK family protein [Verrucomicrobiae bacterium]|nr:ROK family protein [Verrucomicrobiae bacterium]
MESTTPLLAGIEAGGTKYVCAVAQSPEEPLMETRFPTGPPEETMAQAIAFFREAMEKYGPIRAMGIGTFGPADIDPRSPGYGSILTTPKEGWGGFNLVGALREGLDEPIPIAFDTDVNAAAIGEAEVGAGKHHRNLCYITVGTGIGGGFLNDSSPLHGRMHPEIGHMVMPDLDAEFGKNTNVCPFHASCLEGRASGPAIQARWGAPGSELSEDHPAWDLEAKYLAAGALNLTAAWSPDIILIGGGVLQQYGLIDRVRREFEQLAGGYWSLPPLDLYLQTPALDQRAGIVGALALARRLL